MVVHPRVDVGRSLGVSLGVHVWVVSVSLLPPCVRCPGWCVLFLVGIGVVWVVICWSNFSICRTTGRVVHEGVVAGIGAVVWGVPAADLLIDAFCMAVGLMCLRRRWLDRWDVGVVGGGCGMTTYSSRVSSSACWLVVGE